VAWQHQVVAAWHAHAGRATRLRQLLAGAVQRWSQSATSRAFEQWKAWALHRAALHRRMRGLMSLLTGRSLQWAFLKLRCERRSWARGAARPACTAPGQQCAQACRMPHLSARMLPAPDREHALHKRRSRAALHHRQRLVAARALRAWRQHTLDAASFRGVLLQVGERMRTGLMSEAFTGWRDGIRAKRWKAAAMMRCARSCAAAAGIQPPTHL
jgi:hypothetical protein